MLTVATTFSGGFGSVELALKDLGMAHEMIFACEWAKPQRQSYLLNHGEPTSNFYEDIRSFSGTKYKDKIDWLHESPPCQSYSMAGSRRGAADEKGGLMFEAIKKIDEIQPKMFSVENVRGLLSANDGEDWKNILKDFKSLKGYTISWGIMNAKDQGTPQNRERVFIVGFRGQAPQMSFPKRVSLDKKFCDILEDEVDEKYILSNKTIENIKKWKSHRNPIEQKLTKDSLVHWALTARGAGEQHAGMSILDIGGVYRVSTPRECSRIMGDFKDVFKFGEASDTNLYEFIGNAMDISTTKNLITKMLSHLETIKLNKPSEPSFEINTQKRPQEDLFSL